MRDRGCKALLCLVVATLLGLGTVPLPAAAAGGPPPELSAIAPGTAVPGQVITLTGANFGPAGAGGTVGFLGPDVGWPEIDGTVVTWTQASITVAVPDLGVWPGTAVVQVTNPAVSDQPSNRVALHIAAAASAAPGAAASWQPAAANPGTGTLRVGWDTGPAGAGSLAIALPATSPGGLAAFTVPAGLTADAVTVNGVAAGGVTATPGTLTWPGSTATVPGTTLVVTPAPGAATRGAVVVTIAASSGITASPGATTVLVGPGLATVPVTLASGPQPVAGYTLTAPAAVASGSPFVLHIQATDASGKPLTAASGTVYLSSSGDVDFSGGTLTPVGPTTVAATLARGTADVTATAERPGAVTITAGGALGDQGTVSLQITPPADGSGLQLQIFPPYSAWINPTTVDAVASVASLDAKSGVRSVSGTQPVYGGFWPEGAGQPYEAQWTGTITIRTPQALPTPLPQPTLQFAFLNVAAQAGTAALTPVASTGASIDGGTLGTTIGTAASGSGWTPPTVVTLTPGQYRLTVQTTADATTGSAGDTLYYSESLAPARAPNAATGFVPPPTPAWTPLAPVPPAAFGPQGLPSPALVVPIGHGTVSAAGQPTTLPQAAMIAGGRTLLPLRAIAELLGATVAWDAATGGITVSGAGGKPLTTLTLGSAQAAVNGTPQTLDQPPLLLPPGVTMVPLRFLGEALGWQVGWDGPRGSAILLPPLSSTLPLRP